MIFPTDRISDLQKDVQLKKEALAQSRRDFSENLKSTLTPSALFKRYPLPILSTFLAAASSLPFLLRSKKAALKKGEVLSADLAREFVRSGAAGTSKGGGWLSKLFITAGLAAAQSLTPLAIKGAHLAVSKLVKHAKSRKHKQKPR